MLEEEDIIRIVMLTGLEEKGKNKCNDYTSGNNSGNSSNNKTLTYLESNSYEKFGNLTEYTLKEKADKTLSLTDGNPIKIVDGATTNNSKTSPHPSPRSQRSLNSSHPFGTPDADEEL